MISLSPPVVLSARELDIVMDEMDTDGDGYISTSEFAGRLRLAQKDGRRVASGLYRPDVHRPEPMEADKDTDNQVMPKPAFGRGAIKGQVSIVPKRAGSMKTMPHARAASLRNTSPPTPRANLKLVETVAVSDAGGRAANPARQTNQHVRPTSPSALAGPLAARRRAASYNAHPPVNASMRIGGTSPPSHAYLVEAMDRLCAGLESKQAAIDAFHKMDKDQSGTLDARELKTALRFLSKFTAEKQSVLLLVIPALGRPLAF